MTQARGSCGILATYPALFTQGLHLLNGCHRSSGRRVWPRGVNAISIQHHSHASRFAWPSSSVSPAAYWYWRMREPRIELARVRRARSCWEMWSVPWNPCGVCRRVRRDIPSLLVVHTVACVHVLGRRVTAHWLSRRRAPGRGLVQERDLTRSRRSFRRCNRLAVCKRRRRLNVSLVATEEGIACSVRPRRHLSVTRPTAQTHHT